MVKTGSPAGCSPHRAAQLCRLRHQRPATLPGDNSDKARNRADSASVALAAAVSPPAPNSSRAPNGLEWLVFAVLLALLILGVVVRTIGAS